MSDSTRRTRVTAGVRPTLIALLALALTSCFPTDPVRERLEITFHGDGNVTVKVRVDLATDLRGAAKERVDSVRHEYLRENDAWATRFRRVDPTDDRYTIERHEGTLVAIEREMLIKTDALTEVFYDTGILATYSEQNGIAELSVYAGESQRATREQQRLYRELVEGWGTDYVGYLRAMQRLYSYMDTQPDRAAVLFAELIGEERETAEEDEITAEEQELLDLAQSAMDRVIGLFETGSERAYSLEEISSLVNDPFPAAVSVRPAGKIIELTGFEQDQSASLLQVPRASLWSAVESLRGLWLSPDPLAVVVDDARDESHEPPSSEAMASLPRHVDPPRDGNVVWEELQTRMTVPSTLRATWTIRGSSREN